MTVAKPASRAKARIPVTLVTGFLGSGKTTFINAALRSPELAKTVVVVNEFGEVGLDHQLFASSSDLVVVLENGCLCCTVRSDLVGTLNSLYHARAGGRDSGVRQCRDRDVRPRRAGRGPAGVPVGADARRALSRRERADACRRRQLARERRRRTRVCATGRAGGPDPDHKTRPGHGRQAERRRRGSGWNCAGSIRQRRSPRSIGRRRRSPTSDVAGFRRGGPPMRIPARGSTFGLRERRARP